MLNRRLAVLFIAFVLGMVILAFRLGNLQISQADQWRQEARTFVHRHGIIETSRGAILDRNHEPLARDEPCFDLAIDYRAMNLDDRWVTRTARLRLKDEKLRGKEYLVRLTEEKAAVADLVDAIPDAIRQHCGIPIDQVRSRFNDIRFRIRALRQDRWGRKYDRDNDNQIDASVTEAELAEELHDETIAHTLVANIPDPIAFYFLQNKDRFPGLSVVYSTRRIYPFGDVACHIVGSMRNVDEPAYKADPFDAPNLLSDSDPGRLHGYLPGDRMGESGLERFAERDLRGTRGARLLQLGVSDPEKRLPPIPGKDVRLTLDARLQKDLQDALLDPRRTLLQGADGKNHLVTVVVTNMQGEVLLMLSLPTYDLNHLEEQRNTLLADTNNRPLLNRAIAAPYAPGSTIKPLLAAAGLTEKVITPSETITCNGFLFPNRPNVFRCLYYTDFHATHGPLRLAEALEKSCNIYFYTLGWRLGLKRELDWFDTFGIGHPTGIELKESEGVIPDRKDLRDAEASKTESIFLGIGQGQVSTTPLQMANAYATLLRSGEVIEPHLLADAPLKRSRPVTLAPDVLAAVREGMVKVVQTGGTAAKAFAGFRLPVAGKTGSATTGRMVTTASGERVSGDSDAWFVGYAPADNPQYIVAAVMEFGGHGGLKAAPIARETFLLLEKHGYLPKLDVPQQ